MPVHASYVSEAVWHEPRLGRDCRALEQQQGHSRVEVLDGT